MAFILSGGNVLAFAEYSDVTDCDQRLFESNEGIADETMIEDLTEKSTNRILQLIRQSEWWRRYYLTEANASQRADTNTLTFPSVPAPSGNKILARKADFTDLCVYFTLYEYLLPKIADFSNEDNAEVRKIGFYRTKFDTLFRELINDGAWYDFSGDGNIDSTEKLPTRTNLVRIR